MSKIETKWACGNFLIGMAVSFDALGLPELADFAGDSLVVVLLENGIRQIGQRNSEVDKILGAFSKDANGKDVRRKEFKRNLVPYSAELAEKLKESFSKLQYAENAPLNAEVSVVEYVPTAGEPKFAGEKAAMARHESMSGDVNSPSKEQELSVWMKSTIGYDGPIWTEDEEDYHPAALMAVRAFVKSI
jgi:hypothetical protein